MDPRSEIMILGYSGTGSLIIRFEAAYQVLLLGIALCSLVVNASLFS